MPLSANDKNSVYYAVTVVVGPASLVFSRDEQGAWEVWKSSASYQVGSSDWLTEMHIFSFLKPVFPPSCVYFSAAGGSWTFAWLDL